MYPFKTRNNARFFCRTDFTNNPVLNLYFFDTTRSVVLFHLSLRHAEGVAVINRRDAAGWRRELVWKMNLARTGGVVELLFQGGTVRAVVEGRELGRFDRLPRPDAEGRFYMRRGFPRLTAIAYVDVRGDCSDLDLGAMPALSPLTLTDRLEVLYPGDGVSGAQLVVSGTEGGGTATRLPVILLSMPYGAQAVALRSVLPGRIWQGAGEGVELRLLDDAGEEHAHCTLTRAEVAARIGTLAQAGALEHDALAALQAIEHARMGGLFSRLEQEGRAGVAAAAERFGLSSWLSEGVEAGKPATISVAGTGGADTTDQQAVSYASDHFTATMRRAPDTDPVALLRAMRHEVPLPLPERRALILRLAEWFCTHADPRALHALALEEGLERFAPGDSPWHNSIVLPFLYLDARPEQVSTLLVGLSSPGPTWIVTPTLGWVARQAALNGPDANNRPLEDGARLWLVWAFLNLIEKRAADYWDRTPCLSLIATVAELLVQAQAFPRALHDHLLAVALKAYGLSPAFWAVLAARRSTDWPDPPRRIVDMQERFYRLAQLVESGARDDDTLAAIEAKIAAFERLGCFDTARFRRELLGPAGVALAGGAAPEPDALLATGLDPEEAALRHLAFPRVGGAPPPPALVDAAGRGLPAAYEKVPRAPNARLQERLARQAMALLAGKGDLAAFSRALAPLARPQSRYLGFGLSLSLATGLARQGADTGELMDGLAALHAGLNDGERAALADAAAPVMAMHVLRCRLPDHALRAQAEALFGTDIAPLSAPSDDRAADLSTQASPLFDTLVAVYSCQPNLDSRIAAMREGWMQLLEGLGVPFMVFVGGGDGRREGDVVYLDAPDDYEGLPQKSLAMMRWVHDHTAFSHLLKIDDDCFLDPEAFFLSLSHLKFDYYGRPLYRVRGQMDRTWHMAKSRSERGRLELDKSPEPSRYADGGSGYTLSRRAMAALLRAADSPAGQSLAQLSFMEDKLVGDLLATRGITVSGEDYRIAVMRHSRPGGPLVSAWENGFLPFRGGGVKLAHLDGHERQAEVLAQSRQPLPRPAKVWPGYQPVRLGARSNALDLISGVDKLARVNAAHVAVVACLRNEAFMLPHFLAHYRKLGVAGFLIADNGSDDGTLELLADQPDVALFSVDTEYSQSHYGVAWQQALLGNFRTNRWSVVADADELLFWRTDLGGSLPDLVESADFAGADAARLFMLDMYPQGLLAEADFATGDPFAEAGFCDREPFLKVSGGMGPYTNAPVVTSALRHRLLPGSRAELFVAQKTALLKYRPWMRFSEGLHAVAESQMATRPLFFAHFKYNAAFRAKALAEVSRRQHFNDAEEYRKYLALVSEGRDSLFDPAVSVPFDQCAFVRQACGEG